MESDRISGGNLGKGPGTYGGDSEIFEIDVYNSELNL